MNSRYCLFLIAAAFLTILRPSQAASFEAEGVATIRVGGKELTRQSAIRDALRQASMQAGIKIEAMDMGTPSGLSAASSRVRPEVELSKPVIIREWTDGEFFHAIVRFDNILPAMQRAPPQTYKKKIVATPFHVYKSLQLEDIDDISNGFPRELLRRLENTKKFLTKISKYAFTVEPRAAIPSVNSVIQISGMHDSQFVISGEILDSGSGSEGGHFGVFETKKRRFEVEFSVYDGITGTLIAHHRLDKFATGDIFVGRDKPFGSSAFFSTNFGKAVDAMLDSAAEVILAELDALPFTAKIVRIEGGKVYLDAGTTSSIAPGDTLVVYHLKDELPVIGLSVATEYGTPEVPVATVTINQVQPLFSIGELSLPPKSAKVRAGDFVRFESFR